MTLDEVEAKIKATYEWFAVVAPGVRVQEVGDLAAYWAIWDRLTRNQMREMTVDEIVGEFGWTRAELEGLVA